MTENQKKFHLYLFIITNKYKIQRILQLHLKRYTFPGVLLPEVQKQTQFSIYIICRLFHQLFTQGINRGLFVFCKVVILYVYGMYSNN